jgi:hypothetical protein
MKFLAIIFTIYAAAFCLETNHNTLAVLSIAVLIAVMQDEKTS